MKTNTRGLFAVPNAEEESTETNPFYEPLTASIITALTAQRTLKSSVSTAHTLKSLVFRQPEGL